MSASYYYSDGKSHPIGPVSIERLVELEKNGELHPGTIIACPGDSGWRRWSEMRPLPSPPPDKDSRDIPTRANQASAAPATPDDEVDGERGAASDATKETELGSPPPPAPAPIVEPVGSTQIASSWPPPPPQCVSSGNPTDLTEGTTAVVSAPPPPPPPAPPHTPSVVLPNTEGLPTTSDQPCAEAPVPETRVGTAPPNDQEAASHWAPPPPPTGPSAPSLNTGAPNQVAPSWQPPQPPPSLTAPDTNANSWRVEVAPNPSLPAPPSNQQTAPQDPPPSGSSEADLPRSGHIAPKPLILTEVGSSGDRDTAPTSGVCTLGQTPAPHAAPPPAPPPQVPLATTAAEHCASAATELPAETNTKTSIDQTPIPEPPRALDPGAAEVKAAALPTSASKSPLPLRHHRKKAVAIVGVVVALITAAALGWLEMSRRKGPALPKESAGRNTSLDARRSPASAARDSRPSGLLPTARDHSSRPLASLDGSRSPDFVDGVSSLAGC